MKRGRLQASAGLVALASLAVYVASLGNGFVANWDDGAYVVDNPHIRSLDLSFFTWAFSRFSLGNWHPLTWISHALDYAIWGLDPFGHHLHSVILHAINAFLVVVLAARLFRAYATASLAGETHFLSNERTTLFAAVLAGLLFGLHPLHVESVAWISERKDMLSALFYLSALISYSLYAQPNDRHDAPVRGAVPAFFNNYYLLTLAFFILALLSKPMAVTLPVILLILDWFPFNRISRARPLRAVFLEKTPFWALSLASGLLTIAAQRAGGAISPVEPVPLYGRLLVATHSLVAYLGKMAAPFHLVPLYPYPPENELLQMSFENASSIALVVGITLLCLHALKRNVRVWAAVWGCYVVSLLPVLGILRFGMQAMADRYTYLPSIGPFLVLAGGAAWAGDRLVRRGPHRVVMKTIPVVVLVLMVAGLSALTVKQTRVWKSSIDLWSAVIRKEPERAPLAYTHRAWAFRREGRYAEALADLDRAIVLDRTADDAYVNRAALWGERGNIGRALEDLNQAIVLNPWSTEAYANRGSAYAMLGRYDRALADLNKALSLNQNLAEAYNNRAKVHWKTGQRDRARADFHKACDLGYEHGCRALQEF